ncbi:MAG TPA: hypothetical protein VHE99_03190 [Gammaproteobacteria bacterium]|nr:hypothetical protein [Gammaproteobacteria bacterium]
MVSTYYKFVAFAESQPTLTLEELNKLYRSLQPALGKDKPGVRDDALHKFGSLFFMAAQDVEPALQNLLNLINTPPGHQLSSIEKQFSRRRHKVTLILF